MSDQMELKIKRDLQPDRNHDKGGRSFYFFDLDENVFFLLTPTFIFHKETGKELPLLAGELAKHYSDIGHRGEFKDYIIDESKGSFRRFRDYKLDDEKNSAEKRMVQPFLEDLKNAISNPDFFWRGPSWQCFYHASLNQRPVSLITARGHAPETIKEGVRIFVQEGYLPHEPNYLSVFPVSNLDVQKELSGGKTLPVSELKLLAVIASVEKAMKKYGENPHHRFGMSDDDPKNLEMIFKAMIILKKKYPLNSFFVIRAEESQYIKEEVFLDHIEKHSMNILPQLPLF